MPTFESDGTTYEYTHLPVKTSRALWLRLAKVASPALSKLSGQDAQSPDSAVWQALAELLMTVDEPTVAYASDILGKQCTFNQDGGNYRLDAAMDNHFKGKLLSYFRWLAAALGAEYSEFQDFLQGLGVSSPTPKP